ncbi:MAG: DHH family phosphoesterase [Oscillospiraceae bacterium]
MGHRFADLDSVGAAVGVCCVCETAGREGEHRHRPEQQLFRRAYRRGAPAAGISGHVHKPPGGDAPRRRENALLVVVDTNRPEQVEDADLLLSCNRVAVIDHHRVAATYIHNAALGFIEPYASSTCELMTELLQEVVDQTDILRCEAEALLAGIVLDTKSFTIRTGERTFDAAAYLRRSGCGHHRCQEAFADRHGRHRRQV